MKKENKLVLVCAIISFVIASLVVLYFSVKMTNEYYISQKYYIDAVAVLDRIITDKDMDDKTIYRGEYSVQVDGLEHSFISQEIYYSKNEIDEEINVRYNPDNPSDINDTKLSILIFMWIAFIAFSFGAVALIKHLINILKGKSKSGDTIYIGVKKENIQQSHVNTELMENILDIKDNVKKTTLDVYEKIEKYTIYPAIIKIIIITAVALLMIATILYATIVITNKNSYIFSDDFKETTGTVISLIEEIEDGNLIGYYPVYEYSVNDVTYEKLDESDLLINETTGQSALIRYNISDPSVAYINPNKIDQMAYVVIIIFIAVIMFIWVSHFRKFLNFYRNYKIAKNNEVESL